MLRSLDLFSGVGGITHALRGLAHPVMYCEKDRECHVVLEKLMKQGRLPRAPIHDDVAKLSSSNIPKIDMIVAGFPCIGFSTAGVREGLDQPGSRLFFHIIRLAKDLKPPFMFFENVDAILGNQDITKIVKAVAGAGYDMYWVCLKAYHVGAPQGRGRWFCLCVRPGSKYTLKPQGRFARFSWKTEACPRMVKVATPDVRRRNRMLGNSVVPDCVRAAFLSLWTGCKVPIPKVLSSFSNVPLDLPVPVHTHDTSKKFASFVSGKLHRIPRPPGMLPRPNHRFVLDPRVYTSSKPKSKELTSGLVKKPVEIDMWATPRAGNATYGVNFLTNRCARDLGTQIRYERRTPSSLRGGVTNPEFVEWLMGFPPDWTA